MGGLASLQPRILGILECAAANAAQTKLRATEGAQLRLKTYVRRNGSNLCERVVFLIIVKIIRYARTQAHLRKL